MPFSDLERNREAKRNWRRANPEYMAEAQRKHRALKGQVRYLTLPPQNTAMQAVKYAIKTGRLVRPTECQVCWKECKPDAHHYMGYEPEYKLTVQWLCRSCHKRADGYVV